MHTHRTYVHVHVHVYIQDECIHVHTCVGTNALNLEINGEPNILIMVKILYM